MFVKCVFSRFIEPSAKNKKEVNRKKVVTPSRKGVFCVAAITQQWQHLAVGGKVQLHTSLTTNGNLREKKNKNRN